MSHFEISRTVSRVAAIIATCEWEPPSACFALRLTPDSQPDLIVQDQGTIWTFHARSPAAQVWWIANVGDGPCVGRNCCVEPHSARKILAGLQRDGFTGFTGRAR